MSNIFGTHDDNTIAQFRELEKHAVKAAQRNTGTSFTHQQGPNGVYCSVPSGECENTVETVTEG